MNQYSRAITSSLIPLACCLMIAVNGWAKPAGYDERRSPYRRMNLVTYVNPLCGTGDGNNTFPGADAPFGMLQWSPDTHGSRKHPGGYQYADSLISDFSLDHISGAGCPYGENFGFMPLIGGQPAVAPATRGSFSEGFSHRNETAKPGCYGVRLDNGIRVELTATTRTGFGRFTFPKHSTAAIMVNAGSDINGAIVSFVHVDSAAHSVSGAQTGGHFCGYPDVGTVYFYAVFDKPFKTFSTWSGTKLSYGDTNGNGKESGAFLSFDMSKSRSVLVKVSISYVSIADAEENIETENPLSRFSSRDFDNAVRSASDDWNSLLNRIQVSGGTGTETETFYSMLYHALLFPSTCSDVNGRYMGYDGNVHTTSKGRVQYANFSGWDIYRSECQLLAMLVPKHASDMAQSLLVDYQQGGAFPRWGVPNMDSGVMMGDPAAPVIADFYAFGARDFDAKAALAGLVKAATDPHVVAQRSYTYERDALADCLKLGYVPEHQKGGFGTVSMTLEYNTSDFAVSRLAKALGDTADSRLLLSHAQFWKNIYNSKTGYIQMRRRDGSWAPGFKRNVISCDGVRAYVEGTAGQYTWMVPFNLNGLAEKMGGRRIATARLDSFFTKLNVGDGGKDGWMAWMGNEPCLETPWIYCFLGRPYKTQETVRRVMTTLFSDRPDAYPGNDDLGEMSSWYVWGAMGMYPEIPGDNVLVLGSPLFRKIVLHLKRGEVKISARGASENAPYVRSLIVNGRGTDKPWIRFKDISHGGSLGFDLSSSPDKQWGRPPDDSPPSYN